jgi:hypothetical protein
MHGLARDAQKQNVTLHGAASTSVDGAITADEDGPKEESR